jgi:hypothetical protein
MKKIILVAASLASALADSHAAAQPPIQGKLPSNQFAGKYRGTVVNPGIIQKAACPDLAVVMAEKNRNGDIHIVYGVRNVGGADYVTGRNQQTLTVRTPGGVRTFAVGNLRAGDVRTWSEVYRPFEFPFTYKGALSFDPDIFLDGNTRNDDCNRSNNRAQLVTSR